MTKQKQVEEKKWHFTREWEVVFQTVSGRSYKDTTKQPLDWDSHFVEMETKERIFEQRIISTDEWEVMTSHIEAFKVTKGRLTKNLYPDIRDVPATEEDLREYGFSEVEIENLMKE